MTYCDITERQVLKKVVSMKFNQKVRDFNVVLNGEFYFSLNGEDLEMFDKFWPHFFSLFLSKLYKNSEKGNNL